MQIPSNITDWMTQVIAGLPPEMQTWLYSLPPDERFGVIAGTAFAILLVFGLITAAIASSKGRSGFGWFFVGFFFTLIGVIVAAVMPSLRRDREAAPVQVIHTGYAPPPPSYDTASGSAADEIAKAKRLLDDGAITPSEFEAMKAKALRRT